LFISIFKIKTLIVPTDAVINYVTTRKAGNSNQNSASTNGGTLIWIYGYSELILKKKIILKLIKLL
jgi:hypothetical protein